MNVPTLEDLPDPSGKRVLLRADFNVPVTDGKIDDDLRIRAALPTIQWLQEHGATVIACTHFGRPKGKPDEKYSVAPVRERLAELAPGVELLENLRFDPGEEANDPAFVDRLVEGFDLYVNDAFGASHRSHASVVGPPERLPSAAGRLLAKEVEVLGGLLDNPARPFVAILGGAKVSDKLGVIKALLDKVDTLVVGGAMSFTFAMAQGHGVGDSPQAGRLGRRLQGPPGPGRRQARPARGRPRPRPRRRARSGRPRRPRRLEGPRHRAQGHGCSSARSRRPPAPSSGTAPWALFEDPRFAEGTIALAKAVASSPGFTIVGGGDSAAALAKFGLDEGVDHVSTGGGASLELIEQGDLPGLAALRKAQ